MRKEERDIVVAGDNILEALPQQPRYGFKVEDIGDQPIEGEIAVAVGKDGVDQNTFNDQLNFMTSTPTSWLSTTEPVTVTV